MPVALAIIPDVQDITRLQAKKLDCATENFRVGFIGTDFARNEDVAEIFRDAEALQNHAQPTIEVGNDRQLKAAMQLLENANDVGIQFPDAALGEMLVGDLEEIISIQCADFGRDFFQHKISQFVPPIFVVIFTGAIDRLARWHLRPRAIEGRVQSFGVQIQTDFLPNERVMIAHGFR